MVSLDFHGSTRVFPRCSLEVSGKFHRHFGEVYDGMYYISRGFREALEEFRDVQKDFRIDSWGFRGFEGEET